MDTEAIRRQTATVDAARRAVAETKKLIAQASARSGQDTAEIRINGVPFTLVGLNSAYMPQVVEGMEQIQLQCLDLLRTRLHAQMSALEGAEWKLRQMVKAA